MSVNRNRLTKVRTRRELVDIEGSLGGALVEIQRLIGLYGTDALLRGQADQYSESDKESLYVFTMEPESDKMMADRVAYEERLERQVERTERREYERLQAKFGTRNYEFPSTGDTLDGPMIKMFRED